MYVEKHWLKLSAHKNLPAGLELEWGEKASKGLWRMEDIHLLEQRR